MSEQQSAAALAESQALDRDQLDEVRSRDWDLDFSGLRRWINVALSDTGWLERTEALGAFMERDRRYVERVLIGEKPLNLAFIQSLPPDARAIVGKLWAESGGYIVARPVSGDAAVQAFISGLIGMLAPRPALPVRADKMLRRDLPASAGARKAGAA